MKMNKLCTSFSSIQSTYYRNFFGIDGPLELWLNDYILKYSDNKEHKIFKFLEIYTQLVNQSKSVNCRLMNIFQYYNAQIRPTNMMYEYQLIPKNQIRYEVGRYLIGEVVVIQKQSKMHYTLNQDQILR